MLAGLAQAWAADGFGVVPGVLSASECVGLDVPALTECGAAGTRCLLEQPWCAELARRLRQHAGLETVLPASHVAVQCTYFEKSQDRNWLVPTHQDLSIPVAERVNDAAVRGWSEKEGGVFVQPPPAVLAALVAIRLHLDPCTREDGALRMVPGSHLHGVLTDAQALAQRDATGEVLCEAGVGDVIAMRPLVLHASSKSSGRARRRVLHFVFGPPTLPCGLSWRTAV